MNREKRTNGFYYRALTRNMVLIVIIVSFTPMILVSGIILYQFRSSYQEKVYAHLAELVERHTQNIDIFLKEKLGDIRVLARTFSFEELGEQSFLQDRLAALQQEYEPVFVDLGVVNEKGIQIAYAGPFKLGKAAYSEAEWFKKAIENHYFVSDVFLGLRGLPHFIITVRHDQDGQLYILRATVDFVAFNSLVENLRIGETGFAFILNREGELQTKPRFHIMPAKALYRDFLEIKDDKSKRVHIIDKVDDSGQKRIYVASFLNNGDWLMVYRQDARDAFSDLRRAQKTAIVIFLIGGLGIVTMAFVLSRRMVSRVAEADREKEMMDEQMIEAGRLATVGELAAGIAHEINNPVAIMVEESGWIGDLLEEEDFQEGKNLDEFKRALNQIKTQGHRCKEITHKLLSFARKTDSRVQDVQINDLIEQVVALSAQRAKYGNVIINKHLRQKLPLIQASASELQQVFLNLINNALDAMEKEGGTIDITTELEGQAYSGYAILVDVADNGPGIPKANLHRIFDPFFTTKPVGKGTGLGLSICYGIIRNMGGGISVESTVEVGTTFHIRIPLPQDNERAYERD